MSPDDVTAQLEQTRRLLGQVQAQATKLEDVLTELPDILARPDPAAVCRGVLAAVCRLVDARFAGYMTSPSGAIEHLAGLQREEFQQLPQIARAALLGGALWQSGPLRIVDTTAWAPGPDADAYGVLADGRLVRSYVAAPVMSADGTARGALLAGHHRPHAFSSRDETIVFALARHLGVALDSAELLGERSRVADALQKTLLPPLLPSMPGLDLAARYRPSGAGNLVGGDFYDVFKLADDRWGLILGDVSGVGAEAAAVTGVARYTVRALVAEDLAPTELLNRLNQAILRLSPIDRFCTAAYAELTPGEDGARVRVALGGHPPPMVLRDDETVEVLDRDCGTLLGAFEEIQVTAQEVDLRPGDAVVLYTDGVVEARDPAGRQFGDERLRSVLATSAGRSADGIARRIERAVLDHRAANNSDDVAIVVLRARRKGGS